MQPVRRKTHSKKLKAYHLYNDGDDKNGTVDVNKLVV